MIHYAPTHHVGHYTFPEGCAHAWVYNCPNVTSVTFPEGCNEAAVDNCPNVTSITFPAGYTRAWVFNCPRYKSLFDDPRGHQMVYAGGFYHAGCRKFTAAAAIAHWSADTYTDPKRGKAYVAAITAHEAKLQTEATA